MTDTRKPLVVLTGPTAVGKTSLSIRLAKLLNASIISADSMQVYKHMDIGSAKITQEEMDGVKHYLVDVFMPDEEFHVVKFQEYAKAAIEEIYAEGKIPLIVGGTGFYIQALLKDIDFSKEDADLAFREKLEKEAEQFGAEYVHEKLRKVDPKSAEQIHANNIKRVIRALEFYEKTGKLISEHNEEEKAKEPPYNFAYFVLNDAREHLYERIDMRVDQMLEMGLLEEVQKLHDMGYTKDMVSMQGLGYKEMLDYINHEITLEEAIYLIKRDTRHFAKRQLTWFRREPDVIWVEKNEYDYDEDRILAYMKDVLVEKGILSIS